MKMLVTLSLLLNILVLVPVCGSLVAGAGWTAGAYGPPSAARGILLSVYLAILLVSALLLARPVPPMVAALLVVQVAYKLTTPFTVGTVANPVVVSNLAIAAFHCVTLAAIWRSGTL